MKFLQNGGDRLGAGFRLVGRDAELAELSAILMRRKANSVLLVGPPGVGCTSLVLGLQALKQRENAPFDIVSKRSFWLSVDELFSSGDMETIDADFQKMMSLLYRTSDSVLVVEDSRGFIEAARNHSCSHFINALILAVRSGSTQAILEARDDDLEVLLKAHSDIRECLTLMDLEEPVGDNLLQIVTDAAESLSRFHGIKVLPDAIQTAIEMTNKYPQALNQAQPAKSVTVLDRSLAKYRLEAHATVKPEDQEQLRRFHDEQRKGEIEIVKLEGLLSKQEAEEAARKDRKDQSKVDKLKQIGGFDSPEVQEIKNAIAAYNKAVQENKKKFDALTAKVNADLALTGDIVLKEFSRISGYPVDKLREDLREKLLALEVNMNKRIFGQEPSVKKIASGIRVHLVRKKNKQPWPALLMGPSGVGKTETAKVLAFLIYDDENSLTRYDMGQFKEQHAVAKLIGAPPGYEGFELGGMFTNAARKNPKRLYLWDEIEKAHFTIYDILLPVLDEGRITDNRGLMSYFEQSLQVFTTNIGQEHFLDENISDAEAEGRVMEELNATYRPEFLNRFNGRQNIFFYNRLKEASIRRIVRREVDKLDMDYRDQGILTIMPDVDLEAFCHDQYNPRIGGRGLPGYIKANLEPIIVDQILNKPDVRGILHVMYDKKAKKFETKLEKTNEQRRRTA